MTAPRQVLKGKTYLVTRRCSERRFFLKPDEKTNQLFVYLLATTAKAFEIEVHAACVLSNHYHLVVTDPEGRLPRFAQYLNGLLARGMNALFGHWEHFWSPSSYSAVSLETPQDVLEKIAYTLANPVKGGLVEDPAQWPGVWTSPGTIGAETMRAERPEGFFREHGAMPLESALELTVPPGFESPEAFQSALEEVLAAKVSEAQAEVREKKKGFLGVGRIMAQKRTDHPGSREKRRGLNPRIASRDRWKRIEAIQRLESFLNAYRAAWGKLKAKVKDVVFPAGTYWLRVTHGVAVAPA